jgi:hypothetical protein
MWFIASCRTNSGQTGLLLFHDIPQTKKNYDHNDEEVKHVQAICNSLRIGF